MGNDNIGNRIKEKRLLANMSQETLAARIGTIKQTIYKYEKGIVTNIPIDTIIKIANALDTTPEYLMGWDVPTLSSTDKQILEGLNLLTEDDKQILLRFIRSMKEECKK